MIRTGRDGTAPRLPDAIRAIARLPGEAGYDTMRSVWNAMIDQHPAVIVPCRDASDVAAAVAAARDAGLVVCVKGGGHNIGGTAVRDGALMIDLSAMRAVTIDPQLREARVEGGARLADLDNAAQAHGLATPAGVVSDTGVGGLTLGGGFGWLSRLHGLAADNLVAVDIVLADGSLVRASEVEAPDLFWAVRGGGGNFGVATAFTFRLHRVGPEVLFGPTFYRLEDAADVLAGYAAFMAEAPRAATVWVDIATAPPAPFLPETVHGTKVLIAMQCFAGDLDEGARALAPLHGMATPLGTAVAARPYAEVQSFLDAIYAKGARNYWRAHNVTALTPELIEALVAFADDMPAGESDILICALGGAIDDLAPGATAYPHRGVPFMITPGARWRDPADDEAMIGWLKRGSARIAPHARPGAYGNFIAERSAKDAYGDNLGRLATIKARYDPGNVFRVNQNVAPAGAGPVHDRTRY